MDLKLDKLCLQYGQSLAINELSLSLSDVGCLAIIGPSGSGKTTLLRLIAGLLSPTSGSIELDLNQGHYLFDANSSPEETLAYRKRTGMVFQANNLFSHLSVLDNMTLPLIKVHALSSEQAAAKALAKLEHFDLAHLAKSRPSQLSGGQQQRVAIARSAALEPEVLYLDEPTSALDPESTADVLSMIQSMREQGQSIISVTHHMGFALSVPDTVLFLKRGQVVEQFHPQKVARWAEYPQFTAYLKADIGVDMSQFA